MIILFRADGQACLRIRYFTTAAQTAMALCEDRRCWRIHKTALQSTSNAPMVVICSFSIHLSDPSLPTE
jgi:hypothetical protein